MLSTPPTLPPPHVAVAAPKPASQTERLREAAKELEAQFLAEMLRAAGFGKAQEAFGGGAGEEQFSSFLVDHHARALVDRGGIGLSESLFAALIARTATPEGTRMATDTNKNRPRPAYPAQARGRGDSHRRF
jgi:peptidoglycan hydrolase FlgJ